ncbi:MAG TPA: hypothetical protein V6D15_15955 [Oculatellaceae cyanobacterium]|jgi:hypothetical protein
MDFNRLFLHFLTLMHGNLLFRDINLTLIIPLHPAPCLFIGLRRTSEEGNETLTNVGSRTQHNHHYIADILPPKPLEICGTITDDINIIKKAS